MCSSARISATRFSEAGLADSPPLRMEAAFEWAMRRVLNPARSAEELRKTSTEANTTTKTVETVRPSFFIVSYPLDCRLLEVAGNVEDEVGEGAGARPQEDRDVGRRIRRQR